MRTCASGGSGWTTPNPLYSPPEPDEPAEPDTAPAPVWCQDSVQFLEWASMLLELLAQDPSPKRIAWAEWKVQQRYRRRSLRAEPDHRVENNLDGHPCLYQAYLLILDRIEAMELATGVPELEPPVVRVIDQTRAGSDQARGRDVNGILLATGEEEEDRW